LCMAFEQEATVPDGNERDKVEPRRLGAETVPAAPAQAPERAPAISAMSEREIITAAKREMAHLMPSQLR